MRGCAVVVPGGYAVKVRAISLELEDEQGKVWTLQRGPDFLWDFGGARLYPRTLRLLEQINVYLRAHDSGRSGDSNKESQ
jgi:hypothetical protein